ncbi:ATP-binding protein [Geobacter sp.]|uniref:two-component system sensor histidine kinase NtrB n=1 Tax=Geobacter sp. TaxID=46610 RepID=UPI00263716DE|nr:ATP-binding protein [Geobacter sp.]
MTQDRRIALKIAAAYAVAGAVWILFSDEILGSVATDVRSATIVSMVKGWLYVAATAALLFGLVSRYVKRIMRSEEELRSRNGELLESEELFRQLFTQNEDAIVLLTPEGFDVIDVNPAAEALVGFRREELIRLGPWSFIVPDDYESFIQAVPRSGDRPFHLDRLTALTRDGARIFVSIWGKMVQLREKEVIYCSIRDITERVRMEEEMKSSQARLIHANKMASLGVLVSGIAHEINNPNSYVSVNAMLLRDVWRDASPLLAEYAEEHGDFPLGGLLFSEMSATAPKLFTGIVEGARRISAIVSNLKDFAREDHGGLLREVDLNRVTGDAVTILGHHIQKLTNRFVTDYAEGVPPVRGNQQQIEQVIINLVMNALQALPDRNCGVTITTSCDAGRHQVLLTVQDEGEGMSRRVMERITDPFFSTRLDQGGTGLGLSISASIVKEHGGTLEFESLPDRGTTVTVRLPAAGE